MEKVEFLILRNLLYNEEYVRKVIPFIKADYFEDFNQKVVFEEILNFVEEYNTPATKEVLCIEIEKRQGSGAEQKISCWFLRFSTRLECASRFASQRTDQRRVGFSNQRSCLGYQGRIRHCARVRDGVGGATENQRS